MTIENGAIVEDAEEVAEEIAEEIIDAYDESGIGEMEANTPDVDVTVIEAPEPDEPEAKFASVDVGDLHISGPAEMVESITVKYLKEHLDHNPHGEEHTPELVEDITEKAEDVTEDIAEAITPDIIEEQIGELAEGETVPVDVPPGPTDWLYRDRKGH